jgi:hypothetical protein
VIDKVRYGTNIMKIFFSIVLAALVGTGCYTQVKSSGDYWGYTGKHEREKVQVVPNQQDTSVYLDSTDYADDQRSRDDEGYSYDYNTYETYGDNFYSAPNWNYYPAPYVGFSIGFGWHRPWWNFGYYSYYPYTGSYNPYWDWCYQPGFYSYGCIAPIYPFYPYYHSYYGEHFGPYRHHFFDGGRISNSGVRTGRIGGGESRGRGNSTIGSGINNSGSSARIGNSGRGSTTSQTTSQPSNTGRSEQTRQADGGTQQTRRTENSNANSAPARPNDNTAPARSNDNATTGRSNENSIPARSNDNSAPARSNDNAAPAKSNENAAPAKNSSSGRGGGRSENFINSPRNNPRLVPQNNRSSGRIVQNYGRRGHSNSSAHTPKSFAGSSRSSGGGGSHVGSGGGFRGSGGGSNHSGGGGGSSHSGGGGRREK